MGIKNLRLSIESGIGSGSVSLFEEENLLDYRCGQKADARADHLLGKISEIFAERGISKKKVREICYSGRPGSSTGLKIGASIARGLQTALGVSAAEKDLFRCIAKYFFAKDSGRGLIILPAGRRGGDFEWAYYDETGEIRREWRSGESGPDEKAALISEFDGVFRIYMPFSMDDTFERLTDFLKNSGAGDLRGKTKLVDIGENLSFYIGAGGQPET